VCVFGVYAIKLLELKTFDQYLNSELNYISTIFTLYTEVEYLDISYSLHLQLIYILRYC